MISDEKKFSSKIPNLLFFMRHLCGYSDIVIFYLLLKNYKNYHFGKKVRENRARLN